MANQGGRALTAVGTMGGSEILGGFGVGKKKRRATGNLSQLLPDSFGVLQGGYESGAGSADTIQQLLKSFKGSNADLSDFLEQTAGLWGGLEAQKAEKSDAFKYMSDQGNWDLGAMGAYGQQAGMIGRGTRQASQRASQNLASMGLGRGAARAAQTASIQQSGTQAQSDAFGRAYQQSAQNRMQSAGNLSEAHRMLAQMALGQGIWPRISGGPGGENMFGSMAQGAAAGGAIGGPFGAMVGGGLGAVMGNK